LQRVPVAEGINACRKFIPDTTIIFANNNDDEIFEICKTIKMDSILKNTPIIIVLNKYDEEFVLSCFDAGIDDYILSPVKQSDVLIRIIWSLKKNQILRDLHKKDTLLEELNILDKQTGIYSKTAVPRVLANEINSANKYRYPICLMAISLNIQEKSHIDDVYLGDKIKKAVRNADVICNPERGIFYAILPKTDTKGIDTVFERISTSISSDFAVSTGACAAFNNVNPDTLENIVNNALKEAMQNFESKLIIKEYTVESENWLDKVSQNQNNYKFFKQVFSKKLQSVIIPVFEKTKNSLSLLYKDYAEINLQAGDSQCQFSICNTALNIEAMMKLTDTGLPKTVVDCFYTKDDIKTSNRASINLQEINEENLVKLLEILNAKFKEMLDS
ncbi:MAG: hypothetical protein PHV68_07745, partial [Candidatus Gastranaerophilales bacterium]|nr:hypothetical protein [Candidatus Gastranaerophilales bacterium]